jgi:MFS family permease
MLVSLAVQIQGMVVGWQVYEITKQPLFLGLIGLAEVLPNISVALYAGHVVDQLERRLISIGAVLSLVISFFGLAVVSYLHQPTNVTLFVIYFMTAISGMGRGFYGPSVFALLAQIVPRGLLPNASAWNTTTWQTAAVVGPILGGFLYVQLHAAATYAACCMLLLTATILFYAIASRSETRTSSASVIESIKEGLHYVFNHQIILGAMCLDLFGVLFGGAVALLPVFTDEIFHRGPEALGVLRAAPSIGAFAMSALLTRHALRKRAGATFMAAVAGFGLCMIAFGLSRDFYLSIALLALSGIFDAISIYVRATIYQLHTPDDMKGRVASVNSIFISSSNEIGEFESGVTAKLMGTVRSVIFGGCATLFVVATTAWRAPKLRTLDLE